MKQKIFGLFIVMIALVCMGCENTVADPPATVETTTTSSSDIIFSSVVQVGGLPNSATTTSLTLNFSADPTSLTASDIILIGATKGALTGSGTTRNLAISDITVPNGGKLFITVASPNGYSITGSIRTVVVYKEPLSVTFLSATQVGGRPDAATTTTSLSLTFSADPTLLTASDITLTGATKGSLTGSGTIRNLAISDITVANGASVTVEFTDRNGFVVIGSPKTVVVYKGATVTLLAIPDVIAPATGGKPVTSIDTPQYTGIITWSPVTITCPPLDSFFMARTVYTANIELRLKAGWSLNGVAENSFTVAGATATYTVNSGTVTAVFPRTMSLSLSMVTVPAGSFQRDATATNISTITTAYKMSTYEITRVQFAVIMGKDPSYIPESSGFSDPVQMANWYQAIAFCNKLSIAEGFTRVYNVFGINDDAAWAALSFDSIPTSNNATWNAVTATWTNTGYRLPTEMEWMWAAMGATNDRTNGYTGTGINTSGYTKAFAGSTGSNAIGDYAWYTGNTTPCNSKPVGGKLPNELGLYDMSGNVCEWNWDWDALYPTGTKTDYTGAASGLYGAYRIVRGGSWGGITATYCAVADRRDCNPDNQNSSIGFRVVRR